MMSRTPEQLKGIPICPGVVVGPIFRLEEGGRSIPSYQVPTEGVAAEAIRLERALIATRAELTVLREKVAHQLGEAEAEIFDAHLLILEDRALIEETLRVLAEQKCNIEKAFYSVVERYLAAFAQIEDTFIKERAADIKDVAKRILQAMSGGERPQYRIDTPSILVAEDLTPSQIALLPRQMLLGIALAKGGPTSHASILARAIGVPTVLGIENLMARTHQARDLRLDGRAGTVAIVGGADEAEAIAITPSAVAPSAEGQNGAAFELMANLERVEDAPSALAAGAAGVGLFRSEFLWLGRTTPPSEEEQSAAYRELIQSCAGREVTIRTFDLGGDKGQVFGRGGAYRRAIRCGIEDKKLMQVQLRALLRVSGEGRLRILFPMIASAEEMRQCRELANAARQELLQQGVQVSDVPLGAMIEIPAAALCLEELAPICDFWSIGSNDLIQYLLACDRNDPHAAHLYDPTHPAVVRVLKEIAAQAQQHNIDLTLCGEMAAEPKYLPILRRLGIGRLSVAPRAIASLRRA
jgi:phosphoenolpyruvate-protein phosphotransferase (PTS system enzyme I)